jgi:hypothetical protein
MELLRREAEVYPDDAAFCRVEGNEVEDVAGDDELVHRC